MILLGVLCFHVVDKGLLGGFMCVCVYQIILLEPSQASLWLVTCRHQVLWTLVLLLGRFACCYYYKDLNPAACLYYYYGARGKEDPNFEIAILFSGF